MARVRKPKKKKTDKPKPAPTTTVAPEVDEELEELDDDFPGGLPEPEPAPKLDRDRYIEAAGEVKGWDSAGDILDKIESVRTVFPDFNRAVRVGGLPIRRIHTVHGPTHGGKTAFVLGLVKSFVDCGYLAGFVDAEHALGHKFAQEMVADLETYKNFLAVRPKNYEETIQKVDSFLDAAAKVRKTHPDHKSILVVDSINKLVPKRELEKFLKGGSVDEKGAEEMAKGHWGRYRAALNQAWLDHLTPKVAAAECAMVIIAQERDDAENSTKFFDAFKVKGGAALMFDASLVIRVMKGQPVYLPGTSDKKGKEKNAAICGFSHRVRIWKSKVAHMDGRYTDSIFHLSNGKLAPEGLDTARDALQVGVSLGLVTKSGSWFSFGKKRCQGEPKAIHYMNAHPEKLMKLLNDIAAKLDRIEGRAA